MNESKSLGEALPEEIERCQELLAQYAEIGPAGVFAANFIRNDLRAAIKATMEGDVVGMLRAYEALKGYKS